MLHTHTPPGGDGHFVFPSLYDDDDDDKNEDRTGEHHRRPVVRSVADSSVDHALNFLGFSQEAMHITHTHRLLVSSLSEAKRLCLFGMEFLDNKHSQPKWLLSRSLSYFLSNGRDLLTRMECLVMLGGNQIDLLGLVRRAYRLHDFRILNLFILI